MRAILYRVGGGYGIRLPHLNNLAQRKARCSAMQGSGAKRNVCHRAITRHPRFSSVADKNWAPIWPIAGRPVQRTLD